MASPSIGIVGAGLAGLSLARGLARRGITPVVYEQAPDKARQIYGISLDASTCELLARNTDIDLERFDGDLAMASGSSDQGVRRVTRKLLQDALGDGLEVQHGRKVTGVHLTATGPSLLLDDGSRASHHLIVDASGVHSTIRAALLPEQRPVVLPYAVYSGRRSIRHSVWQSLYAPAFKTRHTLVHETLPPHRTRLEITLSNRVQPDGHVDIRYTLSRPALDATQADGLARPTRAQTDATTHVSELFDEVQQLQSQHGLEKIWRDAFDPLQMREDRILHWLMRTVLVGESDAVRLAGEGVLVIGDAAHATAILGGKGANVGMEDALELTRKLTEARQKTAAGLTAAAQGFVRERHGSWREEYQNAQARLGELHQSGTGGVGR